MPLNQEQLIRELRLETGLTQEKFAAELGVTFPTINCGENNRAKPSPLAVEKIEKMVRRLGDRFNIDANNLARKARKAGQTSQQYLEAQTGWRYVPSDRKYYPPD